MSILENPVLAKFEDQFWEQYPIEGTVRFDGTFIVEVLQELYKLKV